MIFGKPGVGVNTKLKTVFINHEGGVSPQIDIGKPDGTVNVKLRLIFNHEEHEVHEGNTKGKDIAPLGLICWLAIIGYKDYAPMGLSKSGKPDGYIPPPRRGNIT